MTLLLTFALWYITIGLVITFLGARSSLRETAADNGIPWAVLMALLVTLTWLPVLIKCCFEEKQ